MNANKKHIWFGVIALPLTLFFLSCGSVSVGNLDPADFPEEETSGLDCTGIAASFSTNVYPIFEAEGCATGGCHGGASPEADMDLSADEAAVFETLTGDSERVNTSDPESSLLARKPTGQDSHGGGTLFSTSSSEYEAIVCWIDAGAPND